MNKFRFAVMGAGNIANKFCDAVKLISGCEVCAIASKSAERAADFASKHNIPASYNSYEAMLKAERPDCVYIAVTNDAHYELTSLCLEHKTPVICEKAMFSSSAEAEDIFARSKRDGIFVMEAMWSRYLPGNLKAKEWLDDGRIGKPVYMAVQIGFIAPPSVEGRYMGPQLGGGAARDITVYAYEIADMMLGAPTSEISVFSIDSGTGVDVTEHISYLCGRVPVSLTCSFVTRLPDELVIYGTEGKIVVRRTHYAPEPHLINNKGETVEVFTDTETKNGFVYEIADAVECIRAGKYESAVVPHSLTTACSKLFDLIFKNMI
ncbi:MAG: Gfo/Idh/MocA family oxidoreductase [Clostridiales bacterium]|nr:Gfo/Idh/MocA family oxidoreductase [Clostridiales bacterium]